MALILNTQTPSGVTAAYSRVNRYNTSVDDNSTECYVSVYLNKAARAAGSAPLDVRKYVWEGPDNPLNVANYPTGKNPQQAIYSYLKTLPDYAVATDDV